MAHHPAGVGVDSLATEAPTFLIKSILWDIFRVIIYSNRCLKNVAIHPVANCNKKLTIPIIRLRIKLKQVFGIVDYKSKEDRIMSQKEMELIDIICNDHNPVEALTIAIQTIIDFLEQPESCQVPNPVSSREPA